MPAHCATVASEQRATYTYTLTTLLAWGGVRLIVNWEEEHYCIEVTSRCDHRALAMALEVAALHGLEAMDEGECETEALENGGSRIWLASCL